MMSLFALTFMKMPPPSARRRIPVALMQFVTQVVSMNSVNFCSPPAIQSNRFRSRNLLKNR